VAAKKAGRIEIGMIPVVVQIYEIDNLEMCTKMKEGITEIILQGKPAAKCQHMTTTMAIEVIIRLSLTPMTMVVIIMNDQLVIIIRTLVTPNSIRLAREMSLHFLHALILAIVLDKETL